MHKKALKNNADPISEESIFHTLSDEDIIRHFEVSPDQGLSAEDVVKRRAIYGPNRLGKSNVKSLFAILLDQFKSLLTALLGGAAGLSFAFNDYAEGIAIVVVILINVSIGFWAESKATRSMEALREMGRATTRVRRDGKLTTIPDEEIVPGDIIFLDAGDIVTTDSYLIESVKLQSNESLLTGEPLPVDKAVGMVALQTPLHERHNMLYKGTNITRGSGVAVAVATGGSTEIGKISDLVETATGTVSPLEHRLEKLSEQLLIAVLILTVLLASLGIMVGRDILLMIKTGIALAVAAIPEGLPIVATLALARGMWKLAEHNALIERLSAVETLGSVSIIFTDKTGTLTENKMTAAILMVPDNIKENSLLTPSGQRALRVCSLCYSGNDPSHLSDPMETALLKAAEEAALEPILYEKKFPRVSEDAFDPDIRMMATVHEQDDKFLYLIKGAPEAVLTASTHLFEHEENIPLTGEMRKIWLRHITELAEGGLRVLALAEKTAATSDDPPYSGLIFLGLISLEDPPRADAAPAVRAAQEAGVRVIMVTGDNAVTAANIAAAVGITNANENLTMEGDIFTSPEHLTQETTDNILSMAVFARMTPKQKLELIELHQQNGAVVAMTGDGVNDAPALKKADVGIAMGLRGTEVAKEAAAMILKDDAFASIVLAIQQGRVIFVNIRKFVFYLLSCNLSEVLVVTCAMLAGLPLPLMPLQILFLNLVTDVFPALALGFGAGDAEILHRPPRPKSEELLQKRHWHSILSYALLMTVTTSAAFIWALSQSDQNAYYASTIAFLTLALGQLWHVFNMRSRKAALFNNQVMRNPFVWAAIVLCHIILALALYIPHLADVLKIVPPDGKGWIVILIASFMPLLIGQVTKIIAAKIM